MFTIESYTIAVLFCFITMICWGSWANTQKLSSKKWPFQLFYWDYVFGIVIITIFLAFSLGSFGENGRSFVDDIQQANSASIISALIGGVIFNFANLLLVIAIEIAGMAIVGGALMPKLQGNIIDIGGYAVNDIKILGVSEINFSFILPLICFIIVILFGIYTSKKIN